MDKPTEATELHGHSGCRIYLIRRGPVHFIRKYSASAKYNSRLEAQMHKQARFWHETKMAPEVLDCGVDDGLFYFDMDYIQGSDVASALKAKSFVGVETIAEKVSEFVAHFAGQAKAALDPVVFRLKFDEISAFCAGLAPEEREPFLAIIDEVRRRDWSVVPSGDSHGDLTLGNMILTQSHGLILIDFLDGPLSSWWLDFAKLHQDLTTHWFLRDDHEFISQSSYRNYMKLLLHFLNREISWRLAPKLGLPYEHLPYLLTLQLLRAVPYANPETRTFLRRSIETLLQQEIPA